MSRRVALGTLFRQLSFAYASGLCITATRAASAGSRSLFHVDAGSRDVIIHALIVQVNAPATFVLGAACQVGIVNLDVATPANVSSAVVAGLNYTPRFNALSPTGYPTLTPSIVVRTGLRGDTDFASGTPTAVIPATAPADVLNGWAAGGAFRVPTGCRLFVAAQTANQALVFSMIAQEVDDTAGPLDAA